MSWNIAFLVIGILALLDSIIVLFAPKWSARTMKRWLQPKMLKRIGIIELLIAIILILIGMNI